MKVALVDETGNVFLTTEVSPDGTYVPPEGLTAYPLEANSLVGPGWRLVDEEFIPPGTSEPAGPPLPTVVDLDEKFAELNAIVEELLIAQLSREGLDL